MSGTKPTSKTPPPARGLGAPTSLLAPLVGMWSGRLNLARAAAAPRRQSFPAGGAADRGATT